MNRALRTAATGMLAQQLNIDTIAHNLANVNTTGFKKSRPEFQDLMYQTLKATGVSQNPNLQQAAELQVGNGAVPVATSRVIRAGRHSTDAKPAGYRAPGRGLFPDTEAGRDTGVYTGWRIQDVRRRDTGDLAGIPRRAGGHVLFGHDRNQSSAGMVPLRPRPSVMPRRSASVSSNW